MMESIRKLHIVLFFEVMCVVQGMVQVCPYSDPRCDCLSYTTCNDLQQIPPLNTGINVSQVDTLLFNDGNITSISNNSLPPGLTALYLYNHPLTNISEDAFDTSAATLQRLYINGAKFDSLPTALNKLTKLTDLTIEDTRIQDWDTATLNKLAARLERLALINVSLSAWPSWISNFQLLHEIDFSWNTLKSIPDDAFSFITDSLIDLILKLRGTGLTHIPQALSTMPSLNILDLRNNNFNDVSELELITGSSFAEKLAGLYLDSAGLTGVTNFSNLTKLLTLSLSSNRISDIPAGSLPSSPTSLYLSNNSLSSVPKDIAGMFNLSDLDLSKNIITVIEANALPSSLTFLNLGFNNLTIISNTTFRNLNLLKTLSMTSNPISTISPAAFFDLASLEYLSITNSQLTEIPLAVTVLSPRIYLYFTTTRSLSCPCAAPHELVQWFSSASIPIIFPTYCGSGQPVLSYLSGQCE